MTVPLSERLAELRPLSVPTAPSFTLIQRSIQRIIDRYDAPSTPPEHEAEKLLAEMLRRILADDWRKVPLSFATRVAGLAFAAEYRDRADLTQVRQFLLAEITVSTKAGFLNPMVRIYMESYAPGAEHTRALARALAGARSRIGPRWQQLLENIPDLFDADTAPRSIAARMEAMDVPWHGLRAIGLRQPHAPGLMDAAHLAYLARIAPRLDQRAEIDRLLGWLKPDAQSVRNVGAGAAITALMRPWMQRQPPKEIMTLLIDRLTENYGHPRVGRHAAWNEVDPAMESVFLRWLMGADIRFLFRVLTEVERNHMWADREDFWWTLHEQGRIDEVWIAFNDTGHRTAIMKLPPDARHGPLRFGHQIGEKDKSLLIMRIGDKVVVEGTYSFEVHAFDARNSVAPKLYEPKYDVSKIRDKRPVLWKQRHQGDWQSRVMRNL
ncbi:EH signature domain-containing protein [Cypionkella sp.]|uniref:EH signature domain-containing protein n=1 Tax=Cypionkella sp. TaxID=2811411 RepID=UPI002AB85692|nr:EH signature domain-containing protein [Cypionkella sp.]MDZ4392048.1 EH signature domain-containing protein [Cypionkella sp.]